MGNKPNFFPIECYDLLNGSQVHWDIHKVIDNGNSTAFLVTCGSCNKNRWVRRSGIRARHFSGLCYLCCHRLILRPPKQKVGSKKVYMKSITSEGYITVAIAGLTKEDQLLCKGMEQKNGSTGKVLEHRLVMARQLGRPLLQTETVHHKHEPKTDNRPENLELRIGQHGKGFAKHDLLVEIDRLKQILDEHRISY